ncbi:PqqD family protein [Sphingomonas sp.]|uniref:PqqD family protein n=1 Tax=Sphingomonas sp. TaxID=28214 RepID=UPI0025FEFD71|nr:PqqD family protein [Sphingomonas sp.]
MDTGVLIIDAAQARFVDLNHAAGHFWQLLVYPRSLRSLIAAARESFDIDAETCRLEIEQWLDDMMEQGLVIRAPAEAGAASRA